MTEMLVGYAYEKPAPRYIKPPADLYAPDCKKEWKVRLHTISNGQLRVTLECQCCFARDTQWMVGVPKAAQQLYLLEHEVLALPKTNVEGREGWFERKQKLFELREQWRREKFPARKDWWDWYNGYLQSDCWLKKRQLIFERDKHKCTRCGDSADQVHHLTYERVGQEFYDDMTSLCLSCHTIEHWDVQ